MEQPILKLEASAGSGKTYRLALEYLGHLLRIFKKLDDKPENFKNRQRCLGSILAITFTVKAAQEMKDRIVQKLKSFALSARHGGLSAADKEFLDQLSARSSLKNREIIGLSERLLETILAGYDDFHVKTIDSLMSAMVKVISPDLGLPADYEIAVDARNEMETKTRDLFATLADNEWPRLERTLREFNKLSSYNGWQADVALADKIVALFLLSLKQGIEVESGSEEKLKDRLALHQVDFKKELKNILAIMSEEPGDDHKNRFLNGQRIRKGLLQEIAAFEQGENNLYSLEKLIGKAFFKQNDPGELLKNETPAAYGQKFGAAYTQMRLALQNLVLDLSILKTVPYREFLPDFVRLWNKDKDTLFVDEFSHILAARFHEWQAEAFPYLYLKMSDRFGHFLFDEFQDTSTLQFQALAPLIDEVLSGRENASLFIVGDRKQAIYRWRGGNSGLMEENALRTEIPAITNLSPGGFSETLDKNWRSREEIIKFNNLFWAAETIGQITSAPELRQAIESNFADSRQSSPPDGENEGGYVELSLHDENDEAAASYTDAGETEEKVNDALSGSQLSEILKLIKRLKEHGYEYSEIAILVRKNDQIRALIRHLSKNGISSVSDQSLLLTANPRVNEIIAFFKFLDYPPDNLNFHSFVSGEIFRAAAAKRFPREMAGYSEEVFIGCQGPLYKFFSDHYPDCWQGLLDPFFKAVGFLPPYDLFSDITQLFRLFENFPGDTPFFLALGDVLHQTERQGGNSITGFLREWDNISESKGAPTVAIPENTPGVRVLTMHQSKGLEFSAVIVPLNDRMEQRSDTLYWDDHQLYHIKTDFAAVQPQLDKIQKNEIIKKNIDRLNLLYVACTRAREALLIPVFSKISKMKNSKKTVAEIKNLDKLSEIVIRHPQLAWDLEKIPQKITFGQLAKKTEKESKQTKPETSLPITSKKVLTRSWQTDYLVFKKNLSTERPDRQGSERGERIHNLLSRLGDFSSREAISFRVKDLAEKELWPEIDISAVTTFLCRDEVIRLLNSGRELYAEKEVVLNAAGEPKFLRLDRLQVSAGEVLLIDFKTGLEKSVDHDIQMQEYLNAVAPLFPGKKCRGYLLYVDRGEVEEVSC